MKRSLGFLLALGVLFGFQGCAFLSGKPPLPKHASIEQLDRGASAADYAAAVASADIIYFPEDRAASAARSEPAALLLEAFRQSGRPFAIGWNSIDATQQPALDELRTKMGEAREAAVARLEMTGSGRAREHCRSVLRELPGPEMHHLALGCPLTLMAKIGLTERLTPEEEQFFPRGFSSPAGGVEAYQRSAAGRDGADGSLATSYRAELLRRQFAAETIVRHFRNSDRQVQLLVFLSQADLETGRGVPFYVAQKVELRQLIFGPDVREPKLLTQL